MRAQGGEGSERAQITIPSNDCCACGLLVPCAPEQRWKHFIALLLLSALMFVLAGAFLPLVLLRPQKFCLFFTLGSILSMASFAVLRGPIEQLKHMFSLQRCGRHSLLACHVLCHRREFLIAFVRV